jgi:lysophospholipase L1-like esterase
MLSNQGQINLRRLAVFAALTAAATAPARAQAAGAPFALRDGDRVVFYGDSITAQRLYTRFTEDFVASRYPGMRITFLNAGVSGDTVEGGHDGDMKARVQRDVAPLHPTVITVMLGMNDGRYTTDYDKTFQAYADGYRGLIAALRQAAPGARLYLIEPSPYDEIAHPPAITGYNMVMVRYGKFVEELGRQDGIAVIDFNQPITAALAAATRSDAQMAGSLLPDRIHPSPAGHWVMAAALAAGWHVDPVVSRVTLDAHTGTVSESERSTVSALHAASDKLTWTELDQADPLPLEMNDTMTQFLVQISGLASLDQEMLRVTGLTAPEYALAIDGQAVGSFSREELDRGVNLALHQTPIEQAAKAIDWAADDRAKLSGTRFDLLTETADIPSRQQAIDALDALDQRMVDDEYRSAQPKPHSFTLTADSQ